jgi:hypothetical protein
VNTENAAPILMSIREHIETVLGEATALSLKDRRIVAHWTLATHGLADIKLKLFPILRLLGKPGCGKSQTEEIIAAYSRHPKRMSLRGMTQAALRDRLNEANNGTAIIEEADSAWKDSQFESLLSDRYSRRTAEADLKEQIGDKVWSSKKKQYFGASVVHRRKPFADAALDGRTITIRFKPDSTGRIFTEFDPAEDTHQGISGLAQSLALPPLGHYKVPGGVPGRIANTWRPVLAIADLLGDQKFIADIVAFHVAAATAELREAQASEPDGLVLRAIIQHVFDGPISESICFANIKLSSLVRTLRDEDQEELTSRQVGQIVRELGFEVKVSNGQSVVTLSRARLLRVCENEGYSDTEIDKLRLDAAVEGTLVSSLESVSTVKESAKENI